MWIGVSRLSASSREEIDAACGQALRGTIPDRRHRRTAEHVMPESSHPSSKASSKQSQAPRRRAFLLGAGAGAAGAVAGAAGGFAYRATRPAAASQIALENSEAGLLPPVPFHGRYQAGILPQPQRQTAVISFNVTAQDRGELIELFQTITARARFLTAGGDSAARSASEERRRIPACSGRPWCRTG